MIDTLRLQLPIKNEFLVFNEDSQGRVTGAETDVKLFHSHGFKLSAGEVEINTDSTTVHRLNHPFESIPSSNSSLAFKLRTGGPNYFAHIELNASPAKLLQGHNVFGSDCPELCIMALIDAFNHQFPQIGDLVDYDKAEIAQIDCTYSATVLNRFIATQILQILGNVSTGRIKASNSYDSSATWNLGSKRCSRLVYLKEEEVKKAIDKLTKKAKGVVPEYITRQLQALQSDDVQSFIHNTLRFEAKIRKLWLKDHAIPTRIIDFIKLSRTRTNLIQEMWEQAFNPLFKTFEGHNVDINNNELVHKELRAKFVSVKNGKPTFTKANNLYRFFINIKNEGLAAVKASTSERAFYRNMAELTKVVPRSAVANLTGNSTNIIPLVRMINVDFAKQVPDSWQEPEPMIVQLGR